MSGVQIASGGSKSASLNYSVTLGNPSGLLYGFFSPPSAAGSISPTTLKGVSILQCFTEGAVRDFGISLVGTGIAQSFWHHLVVQSTAGTWRSFNSSAASFNDTGTQCNWFFGAGASPVWTSTAGPRPVAIFV